MRSNGSIAQWNGWPMENGQQVVTRTGAAYILVVITTTRVVGKRPPRTPWSHTGNNNVLNNIQACNEINSTYGPIARSIPTGYYHVFFDRSFGMRLMSDFCESTSLHGWSHLIGWPRILAWHLLHMIYGVTFLCKCKCKCRSKQSHSKAVLGCCYNLLLLLCNFTLSSVSVFSSLFSRIYL